MRAKICILKSVFILYECICHIGVIKETFNQYAFYKLMKADKCMRFYFVNKVRYFCYLIYMFSEIRDETIGLS